MNSRFFRAFLGHIMLASGTAGALLAALALLAPGAAQAVKAPARKTPPPQETYSATDEGDSAPKPAPVASAKPAPRPEIARAKSPQPVPVKVANARQAAGTTVESRMKRLEDEIAYLRKEHRAAYPSPVLESKPMERGSFDQVPAPQRDSISQRLKLVERLIRVHGRAYDYRVHTFHELSEILAHLDGNLPPPPPPVVESQQQEHPQEEPLFEEEQTQ